MHLWCGGHSSVWHKASGDTALPALWPVQAGQGWLLRGPLRTASPEERQMCMTFGRVGGVFPLWKFVPPVLCTAGAVRAT